MTPIDRQLGALLDALQRPLLARAPGLSSSQPVSLVTSDSRAVKPGSIFVAVKGVSHDGHAYIAQARASGAACVVGESLDCDVRVEGSARALAELASAFYGHPSRSLRMVGVTGTSGKTTTSFLLESIFAVQGDAPGLLGTVVFRQGGRELPSTHTTPGAVELQRLLAEMRDQGAKTVVMEVSSHALEQRRSSAIAWDAAAFLNLSPEHLDFHPSMEAYFSAKKLLFTECAEESRAFGKSPRLIANRDDVYGARLLAELPGSIPFGGDEALRFRSTLAGIEGEFEGQKIRSGLVGAFNIQNILAAARVARALGVSPTVIARGIEALPGVPGRLESVPNPAGIHVLVDYAHKPDALEKVLATLRQMKPDGARLITVFGCGGDRDRQKRPKMGEIAQKGSDQVWVTSDNPRTEEPRAIIEEILSGMGAGRPPEVEADRKLAIHAALRAARPGDLVLIAGKGHEDYQILGTQKFAFDDRKIAAEYLTSLFRNQ